MRVTFCYPSSHHRTAGVWVIYELANGLTRLGHDVRMAHGPAWPGRIDSLDELSPFPFEPGVQHFIVDSIDASSLPEGDVIFFANSPPELGLPASLVQGYKMMSEELETASFRIRAPKFCVARWLIDVGRELGVPDEQLIYLPLGIDHETFRLTQPLAPRHFDVAFMCNLHIQKGWDVSQVVIDRLAEQRPNIRVAVFGIDRPDSLPEQVSVFDNLTHEQLATEVYGRSKIFVQSSRVEGFGYPPVEAMACGAALVTTDNGGSRDYGIHGETALVVPTADPDAILAAVLELLDDESRRQDLVRAGVEFVKRFDWNESSRILAESLQAYLDEPDRFRGAPAELT